MEKNKLTAKQKLLYHLAKHSSDSRVEFIVQNNDDNELFEWLLRILKDYRKQTNMVNKFIRELERL
jgi:hypothetical protein